LKESNELRKNMGIGTKNQSIYGKIWLDRWIRKYLVIPNILNCSWKYVQSQKALKLIQNFEWISHVYCHRDICLEENSDSFMRRIGLSYRISRFFWLRYLYLFSEYSELSCEISRLIEWDNSNSLLNKYLNERTTSLVQQVEHLNLIS